MCEKLSVIESQEESLSRHLSWISNAEGKAGILLGINTAICAVISYLVKDLQGVWLFWYFLFLPPAIVFFVSFSVVMPKLNCDYDSLVYFGTVASKTENDYMDKISDSTEESYGKDLLKQCHVNAKIAKSKFRKLIYMYWVTYIGIIAGCVGFVVLFQKK